MRIPFWPKRQLASSSPSSHILPAGWLGCKHALVQLLSAFAKPARETRGRGRLTRLCRVRGQERSSCGKVPPDSSPSTPFPSTFQIKMDAVLVRPAHFPDYYGRTRRVSGGLRPRSLGRCSYGYSSLARSGRARHRLHRDSPSLRPRSEQVVLGRILNRACQIGHAKQVSHGQAHRPPSRPARLPAISWDIDFCDQVVEFFRGIGAQI